MVFLGTILNISNQTGMLPTLHKNNPLYLLRAVVNLIGAFSIIFHCGWFYYVNNKCDFVQATFGLGMCMCVLMHVTKVLLWLTRNNRFLAVYLRLKQFYDDPTLYGRQFRDPLDHQLQFFTQNIIRFVVVAGSSVTLTPVVVKLLEYYRTGAIVQYRWDLPMPYASPFADFKSSPTYEFTYVTFALSFGPDVFFAYSVDFVFMGMCVHIYGLFKELEHRFQTVGVSVNGRRISKRQFRENYKNCIDFQNEIYEIVKATEDVFVNIFGVQFIGTIIIICTQAFLATQNTSNGRVLANVFYSACAAGEIILFTICGSLITQGNELSIRALLDNDWFGMDPSIRQDFAFMVKRSQKLCRVSFHNWIDCSLESLRFVLTSSFNMFAMLQHIARRKGGKF